MLCALVQSVKDMPIIQDGPPPGGFPSVRYARRIPSTGPTGFTLFAVGAAVMAFGFYRVSPVLMSKSPGSLINNACTTWAFHS